MQTLEQMIAEQRTIIEATEDALRTAESAHTATILRKRLEDAQADLERYEDALRARESD